MAKWWCTELQKRVVDRCLQLHGGYGYMIEYPIARAYADARITTIYGGTTEIMKEIIGRSLGLYQSGWRVRGGWPGRLETGPRELPGAGAGWGRSGTLGACGATGSDHDRHHIDVTSKPAVADREAAVAPTDGGARRRRPPMGRRSGRLAAPGGRPSRRPGGWSSWPTGPADGPTLPPSKRVASVYNEQASLADSVDGLHHYLATQFPFTWRITIADNASTDARRDGAGRAPAWRALRPPRSQGSGPGAAHGLDRQERGRAGLHRRGPVHPPSTPCGAAACRATRTWPSAASSPGPTWPAGPQHEAISRTYRGCCSPTASASAQCGFKAVRASVARTLHPRHRGRRLVLRHRGDAAGRANGLRIHEVAVDWMDDLDGRVDVARTGRDDLRGPPGSRWRFASGAVRSLSAATPDGRSPTTAAAT